MQAIKGVLLLAVALCALLTGSASASAAYSAASANPRPLPWTGWNGRPIRHPHQPVDPRSLAGATYPVGWSAGAVRYGSGYRRPSERVREVQRRLTLLGYHTGPVDGLYGPLTRSAVQWFQIKHGLRPTGVVAAATLAVLLDPHGFTHAGTTHAKTRAAAGSMRHPAVPAGQLRPPERHAAAHGPSPWLLLVIGAIAAAMSAAATLTLVLAARARRSDDSPSQPVPLELPAQEVVLGYVSSDDPRSGAPDEAAIRAACADRGWRLAVLVRDSGTESGEPLGQSGLTYALGELSEGRASRLVVHRLTHLVSSVAELRVVLGWFMYTGVALTALDVGLDTSSSEGRLVARVLMSLAGSEQPAGARRRAVKERSELLERIRSMRASGMTLQAIADVLNDEGVPTVRGGARWLRSSVQFVLAHKGESIEKEEGYVT
ncbi:MAG TPA: peptidoglycan-binding protein [Thermoleophilaceae bacterium]